MTDHDLAVCRWARRLPEPPCALGGGKLQPGTTLGPVPIVITDHADPRLEDYVALTDVALRRRAEPERGLYIAESEKVIRRALTAGHRPRSLLMAERWLSDLADVVADAEAQEIPVFVGEHDVIERLTPWLSGLAQVAPAEPPASVPQPDDATLIRRQDWEAALMFVVKYLSIAMVLHGLYDTLLKKEYEVWALAIAVVSWMWLGMLFYQRRAIEMQSA